MTVRPGDDRPARPADGTGAAPGAHRSPVVVVGLGPVGATVALLLARAGVPVVAIDRDLAIYPHPRAVALDDDALRVLQAAGVRATPSAEGPGVDDPAAPGLHLLPGGTVRIRGRGGRPLVELGPPPTSTGHPGLAFFRQPQLERAMRARLSEAPSIDLRLGTTVLGVRSPGGADRDAELRVAGPDGIETVLRAPWVLACDGARSTIRAALGIRLRGTSSPSRWLVVDTDAPAGVGSAGVGSAGSGVVGARSVDAPAGPFRPDDFEFGADPHGPWVHGPLPGGAHRWEFLLPPTAGRGEADDPRAVQELLARRSPGAVPTVRRAAVYAFHARVAARWRVGRVLLLGDAAHLSPPFAGQGLCAGLRDAGNVAWKVAAAWSGTAEDALLDTYARERLPHVVRTTALAVLLGTVVELRRTRPARIRDAVLRRAAATGPVRRWIAEGGWRPPSTLRRGLLARSRGHRWRAGEALPQPRLSPAGAPPRGAACHAPLLDDVLPVGWVLLGAEDAGPASGRGVTPVPWSALPDLPDLRRWLAAADVALVRPDRVVFGTARAGGQDDLLAEAAASAAFGGPRPGPP